MHGIALPTRVVEIGWRRRRGEIENVISILGLILYKVILHNEITQAIKYRFALIDLNTSKHVRSVANEDIRSRIDSRMGESPEKIGWQLDISGHRLMRMNG